MSPTTVLLQSSAEWLLGLGGLPWRDIITSLVPIYFAGVALALASNRVRSPEVAAGLSILLCTVGWLAMFGWAVLIWPSNSLLGWLLLDVVLIAALIAPAALLGIGKSRHHPDPRRRT